jgi:hypothetical protein
VLICFITVQFERGCFRIDLFMPTGTLNFRIVAIGPSDVQAELQSIEPVIAKLSREFLIRNVTLSFHNWTHLPPGIGSPQKYIDSCLEWETVDFVIGAMWKRFGSSLNRADSGTEHECNEVLRLSKRGQPDLLFYFRETPDVESSPDYEKIRTFRSSLYETALVATYSDPKTFAEQVETAIRTKVEGQLLSQKQTQRRIGRLPVNRSFAVELIIFAEFPKEGQTPTIVILKDCHDRFFVIDTRYSTAQDITNWIAQSMGFALTEGMSLRDCLMKVNIKNIKDNNGLLQLWLGNIIYADHPTLKMKQLKIALGSTHMHEKKLGWDKGKTKRIPILLKKPQIIINEDGSKKITL